MINENVYMTKEDAEYCKTCKYCEGVNGVNYMCMYITYTNKKRPCDGGVGCTEKDETKKRWGHDR